MRLLNACLLFLPSLASAGNLALSPSLVDFGEVRVGQSGVLTTRVVNHGSPTTIRGISPATGCLEFQASAVLPVVLFDLDTLTITVTFTPTNRGPDLCAFELDDDNGVRTLLGATGIGTASTLLVYSQFVTFATQEWTTAVPETVHVPAENIGNIAIEASNFTAWFEIGADFQLGAIDFPIPPGGVRDIPMIFSPGGAGPRLDQVTFSVNNDLPTDPDDVLQVHGNWHSTTSVPDATPAAGRLRIGPTPTRGDVAIHYSTARSGRVEIEIRDVAGRTVARHSRFSPAPGPESVTLRRQADWAPGPGVYLVRVSLEGETLGLGRVVVVK